MQAKLRRGARGEAFVAPSTRALRFSCRARETNDAGQTNNRICRSHRKSRFGIERRLREPSARQAESSYTPRGVEYGEGLASRRGGGSERRQRRGERDEARRGESGFKDTNKRKKEENGDSDTEIGGVDKVDQQTAGRAGPGRRWAILSRSQVTSELF